MNVKIEVPENIATPLLVKNEDEFLKLLISVVLGWSVGNYDVDEILPPLTHLLHDYLALVLTGKITPYEVRLDDKTIESARQLLNELTIIANNAGVPLKETEKGEMQLDIEAIMKRAKSK